MYFSTLFLFVELTNRHTNRQNNEKIVNEIKIFHNAR